VAAMKGTAGIEVRTADFYPAPPAAGRGGRGGGRGAAPAAPPAAPPAGAPPAGRGRGN
jgi:hypothetical protein